MEEELSVDLDKLDELIDAAKTKEHHEDEKQGFTMEEVTSLLAAMNPPATVIGNDYITNNRTNQKVWNIPFENAIPKNDKYFVYLKNEGFAPIELIQLTLSASVGGVLDTKVILEHIAAEEAPMFPQSDRLKAVNLNLGSNSIPAIEVYKCNNIINAETISVVDSFQISEKFERHTFKLGVPLIINPIQAIALRWGVDEGSVSGSLTISEIV